MMETKTTKKARRRPCTISLPPSYVDRLEDRQRETGASKSEIVRRALDSALPPRQAS